MKAAAGSADGMAVLAALSYGVIATFPRCHLEAQGEISCHEGRDFSLRFEMTTGAGT